MTRALLAVYRSALHLYPRTFRRDYGDALVQTVLDQCTFGGRSLTSVVVRELPDVAGSALRMRGESPMSRLVVFVIVLATAVLAAMAAGPLALVPMAVVAVAILVGMRRGAPIDNRSGHASRWLIASAAVIAIAVALPAIDGGELSEPAWGAMAVLIITGVALALTGLGQLLAADRSTPPPTTR